MKQTKKIAVLILALAMLLAMSTAVFAADTGSITISNPVDGETYNIYLMFELESYNTDINAFSYKVTEAWKPFVNTGAGKDYFTVNEQGYVTLKDGVTVADNSDRAAELAKAALAYAKANGINPTATLTKDNNFKVTGLTLGYYLVDSSLGALCGLTTTKPDATIAEKNEKPGVDKEVKEGSTWGETSDASIGDTVYFRTTVHAKKGAQSYVLHDKMSAGLTFDPNSVSIAGLTRGTDYEVVTSGLTDGCTFEIRFKQSYLDTITGNTDIVVTYSATLNDKAVISTDANTNETRLGYGNSDFSEWDETKTYTYKFDLVKTNTESKLLDGALFKLYDNAEGGNEIALIEEEEGVYRVATPDERNAANFTPATIKVKNGQAVIKGLDTGSYWLAEIQAPSGFNKLPGRVEVKINGANLDAVVTDGHWASGGVKVENKSGTELPSTGGMGTTIFYIAGAIMVVGAAVLLITRKRMGSKG